MWAHHSKWLHCKIHNIDHLITEPCPKCIKPYEQFYNQHIKQIGESLNDFYHDFKAWKAFLKIDLPDEEAFKQYTKELLAKWERIAKQEGIKKQ